MAQSASDIAAKWAQGMQSAGPAITAGVQANTVAPGLAAARQQAAWVANTTAAASKWATNVAKVSNSDWQQAMITKGVPRIATGATAAQPAFEAFMNKLLPAIASVKSSLPPRGNLEQNITRAGAFARGMAAQSFK